MSIMIVLSACGEPRMVRIYMSIIIIVLCFCDKLKVTGSICQ